MTIAAIAALAFLAQSAAQQETSFAFAHTDSGAMAWNIGRLQPIPGRHAFRIPRLYFFSTLDAAAGYPFPYVLEPIEIDCESRRYTSTSRVFFEPRTNAEGQVGLYLAATETDPRTEEILTGTDVYSVYESACLDEDVTGYFIEEMTSVAALAYLSRFSETHSVGEDVTPGEVAPEPTAEASES